MAKGSRQTGIYEMKVGAIGSLGRMTSTAKALAGMQQGELAPQVAHRGSRNLLWCLDRTLCVTRCNEPESIASLAPASSGASAPNSWEAPQFEVRHAVNCYDRD